jgi:hypothetical protein
MRLLVQFVGTLLLVGFMLKFWWLIALAVGVVLVWRFGPAVYREYRADGAARRRQLSAIAARADQQHRFVLAGDDRGLYGQYPPAAF